MSASALIGLILIVIGGALMLMWLRIARQARAAWHWPSTQGVIIGGELRTLISPQAFVLSQGGLHPRAEPRIEYEYQVEGQTYQSDKVRLGTWSLSVREATEVMKAYAPGSMVTVYYDPLQPARAILKLPDESAWGGIAIGAACALIGVGLMFVR